MRIRAFFDHEGKTMYNVERLRAGEGAEHAPARTWHMDVEVCMDPFFEKRSGHLPDGMDREAEILLIGSALW